MIRRWWEWTRAWVRVWWRGPWPWQRGEADQMLQDLDYLDGLPPPTPGPVSQMNRPADLATGALGWAAVLISVAFVLGVLGLLAWLDSLRSR